MSALAMAAPCPVTPHAVAPAAIPRIGIFLFDVLGRFGLRVVGDSHIWKWVSAIKVMYPPPTGGAPGAVGPGVKVNLASTWSTNEFRNHIVIAADRSVSSFKLAY